MYISSTEYVITSDTIQKRGIKEVTWKEQDDTNNMWEKMIIRVDTLTSSTQKLKLLGEGRQFTYTPFGCRDWSRNWELESTFQNSIVWLHVELRFEIRDPISWNWTITRNSLS
jgi:hypothetical protein